MSIKAQEVLTDHQPPTQPQGLKGQPGIGLGGLGDGIDDGAVLLV